MGEKVVVIGASNNETRYAHKAMSLLMENGHDPIPVTPKETMVLGVPAVGRIEDVEGPVDTVTIYVRPGILTAKAPVIASLAPKRVIFNPGTEDGELMKALRETGITVIEACTIVMQKTGQF
jgi:predicted CoA-binding protein